MLHVLADSLQKAQRLVEHNGHGDLGQLLQQKHNSLVHSLVVHTIASLVHSV